MSEEHKPQVGPVMMFTPRRRDVDRFYTDIIGLAGTPMDDATWMDADNAKVVIHDEHHRETPAEIREQTGFVVWFGVEDVRATFDKARRADVAASDFYGDYFFARDPDGRFVGIYALEDHAHGHDHEH
ncbi:MAG TPA: hypothetical protein VEU77_06105 [Candidatus Acidoferrales bacterium]|nr:hypothetical protein [Candidatus Acidoferrales bacterium]